MKTAELLRGRQSRVPLFVLGIYCVKAKDVVDPPLIANHAAPVEGAKDLPSGTASLDDAGAPEDAQMPGDQRLAEAQFGTQGRDRHLLVLRKVLGDAHPFAVGEGAEEEIEILHKPIFVR